VLVASVGLWFSVSWSSCQRACERNKKLEQIVHGSGCRGIRAKFLADADQHQGGQQAVKRAAHSCTSFSMARMARPITSATWGTTAFPRQRNRSTREGIP